MSLKEAEVGRRKGWKEEERVGRKGEGKGVVAGEWESKLKFSKFVNSNFMSFFSQLVTT